LDDFLKTGASACAPYLLLYIPHFLTGSDPAFFGRHPCPANTVHTIAIEDSSATLNRVHIASPTLTFLVACC
jgi:hypothetical protein